MQRGLLSTHELRTSSRSASSRCGPRRKHGSRLLGPVSQAGTARLGVADLGPLGGGRRGAHSVYTWALDVRLILRYKVQKEGRNSRRKGIQGPDICRSGWAVVKLAVPFGSRGGSQLINAANQHVSRQIPAWIFVQGSLVPVAI